jgi:hypothetical protein
VRIETQWDVVDENNLWNCCIKSSCLFMQRITQPPPLHYVMLCEIHVESDGNVKPDFFCNRVYRLWIRITLNCLSIPRIHGVNDLGGESSRTEHIVLSVVGDTLN